MIDSFKHRLRRIFRQDSDVDFSVDSDMYLGTYPSEFRRGLDVV